MDGISRIPGARLKAGPEEQWFAIFGRFRGEGV